MKKERYFRLENDNSQEFVIIGDGDEPCPKHGIDLDQWPIRVELTAAEFNIRKGERPPNPTKAERHRKSLKIHHLTTGELEELIDSRISAILAQRNEASP